MGHRTARNPPRAGDAHAVAIVVESALREGAAAAFAAETTWPRRRPDPASAIAGRHGRAACGDQQRRHAAAATTKRIF